MKKHKNKSETIYLCAIVILSVLLFLSVVLTDFTFSQNSEENISVVMRENDETLYLNMLLGAQRYAQEVNAQVNIYYPQLSNNHESQMQQIEYALKQNTSAIILQPANSTLVELYFSNNPPSVPIIYIEGAKDNNFVGPNNSDIGKLLAQSALETEPKEIILLKTAQNSFAVEQRLISCFDSLIGQNINITILTCNTDDIFEKLPKALQQTGAKTVIAFEQSATRDMYDVSMQSGIKELELLGIGIEGEVINGLEQKHMAGVIVWNEFAQGYIAMQNIIAQTKHDANTLSTYDEIAFKLIKGSELFEPENERLLFPVF